MFSNVTIADSMISFSSHDSWLCVFLLNNSCGE